MAFVVARFNDGVEIISSHWILMKDDIQIAKWPKHLRNQPVKFKQCLTAHETPSDSWTDHPLIRDYGSYDDFAKAEERASEIVARDQSTCEDENVEQVMDSVKEPLLAVPLELLASHKPLDDPKKLGKKRKRERKTSEKKKTDKKKKPRTRDEGEDKNKRRKCKGDHHPTESAKKPSEKCSSNSLKTKDRVTLSSTPEMNPNRAMLASSSSMSKIMSASLPILPSSGPNGDRLEVQDEVVYRRTSLGLMRELEDRVSRLEKHLQFIRVGVEALRQARGTDIVLEDDGHDWADCLPLETESELRKFNARLSNTEFKNRVAVYLARYGTKNIEETIRELMGRVISDELARQYTFLGKRENKGTFSSMPVCDVILSALRSNGPTAHATMDHLKKEGGKFLTKAKSRLNLQKNKAKAKGTEESKEAENSRETEDSRVMEDSNQESSSEDSSDEDGSSDESESS